MWPVDDDAGPEGFEDETPDPDPGDAYYETVHDEIDCPEGLPADYAEGSPARDTIVEV